MTKLSRNELKSRASPKIFEQWFPGCHYDIGRQRFKFLPQKVHGLKELSFLIPNLLSGTLEPNEVLSDLVLQFMLTGIRKTDPEQTFIRSIEKHISDLTLSIETARNGVGSGDVYSQSKWVVYAPFGRLLALFPTPSIITETISVLLAIRDRRIPDLQAEVYRYYAPYRKGSKSIAELAKLTPERYPSKTYLAYREWRAYFKGYPSVE